MLRLSESVMRLQIFPPEVEAAARGAGMDQDILRKLTRISHKRQSDKRYRETKRNRDRSKQQATAERLRAEQESA